MNERQPHRGLFRGSEAIGEEMLTWRQLSSGLYRRVLHNVYMPSCDQLDYVTKCHAAALIAPPHAVLTGRSAAAIRGLDLAVTTDPVEFVVAEADRFGPVREFRIRRTTLTAGDYEPWQGIRLATPKRLALDLLLRHTPRTQSRSRCLRTAVSDLDCALRAGLVSEDQVAATLWGRRDRGIALAREAFELRDARAESRPESEYRVILTLAGLPPEPQFVVRCPDGFEARLDLGYPEHLIAVEYDGEWHNDEDQPAKDLARRERLRALGWRVLVYRARDLRDTPDQVVADVRALMG
ncbi:endonuclease domain-containing protein [Amycolatopsis sp. cg5]|uniref:endonuclease domain-containing protein n=1 Tax=Amycolatopsis sp. cg5 TaxID=3238802 RepID=UPI00352669B6